METRKTNSPFEYFLYAAIVAETALAAIIYKMIFQSGELMRLRIYFALFYFGFLAWAIAQLNRLHRNRQRAMLEPATVAEPARQEIAPAVTRPVLGLTAGQFMLVVVVFASAVATFSWALRAFN